ncbi:putative Intradiol ring-cleavage dioxygenases domain-containing protein [Seiridium cardinale]|uniref:Intradiol ring-cleavage dioxygenases domain-containing protein n=1 Tax=Seiridium cardinale TaxID=138064 RepID=A0ABR2XML9_9PEZI
MRFSQAITSGLALLSSPVVLAHPGHDVNKEIAARQEYLSTVKRTNLGHCADKLKVRGIERRNVARRHSKLQDARAKSIVFPLKHAEIRTRANCMAGGLKKRDLGTVLATSHNATALGYNLDTPYDELFSGLNNSCLLSPEATQGPYYVGGEYVRENVIEDQEGVDMILDYQVIDVDTCEPVPEVYLEMWHCNSTGVYSGIVAGGNGNKNDTANLDTTFLRGIQKTDADGVAQFETLFPGHYLSRTNHIHILVHSANSTAFSNDTLGNTIWSSHVGQTFFDQDLIDAVETLAPYNTNWQPVTLNEDDNVLQGETATDGIDPVFQYTLLTESIADGLFGWIAFGINTTQAQSLSPAAFYYEDGGVTNPNQGSGPGGPPPP